MRSIRPATGETLREYPETRPDELDRRLSRAAEAQAAWARLPIAERAEPMRALAAVLRRDRDALALLATDEMGKPIGQAESEVDLTKSRIAQMELKAPSAGLLTLNTNCAGAFMSSDCKPYKVGDNISSTMALGQIPDLSSLEMDVSVEEGDRGRRYGQERRGPQAPCGYVKGEHGRTCREPQVPTRREDSHAHLGMRAAQRGRH